MCIRDSNAVVLEDPALAPNPLLANNARGIEVTEELPDARLRTSLFGRVRRSLKPGTAVELGARLYDDSWGISAFNVEPRLYQALAEDWSLRLRYRYYDQTAADDFGEQFIFDASAPDNGAPEFRTQDSDLGAFVAQTFGAQLIWDMSDSSTIDVGIDFITRSDGLDQLLVFFGWNYGL